MKPPFEISVVVPAHNPDPGRLRRTLLGLKSQTLQSSAWETVLVDNASERFPDADFFKGCSPPNFGILEEPTLGLSSARRAGIAAARGPIVVLVDDDNVLAPDYLARVLELFAAHPEVGALGGRILPEFERQPEAWQREFLPLLALREAVGEPKISRGLRPPGASINEYPVDAAPNGAGMAIRTEAARQWIAGSGASALSDRKGRELSSGGDNDIVLEIMRHGWEVGTFPELSLTHLIPRERLETSYLARLNRGIQKSWLQVLLRHDASPWPPIPGWTLPLRRWKAWFTHRAWSGPAAYIRWKGACGHFEGRVRTSG
jgi:glycosyltransferase involved in cell wall biosynthesis